MPQFDYDLFVIGAGSGGIRAARVAAAAGARVARSEEHTSELQSLMRISYAVFCLKKKKNTIKLVIYIKNTNFKITKFYNIYQLYKNKNVDTTTTFQYEYNQYRHYITNSHELLSAHIHTHQQYT